MTTRDQIKVEIDKVPQGQLLGVLAFVRRIISTPARISWTEWKNNLDLFTPDFMIDRNQLPDQTRDSFES